MPESKRSLRKSIPVGRFAPSPTGALHLGSLITAIASYCLAKRDGGQWLVRIEDVDTERCRPMFATQILKDLERLGLHWDGAVHYQSQHFDRYHDYLDQQLQAQSYGCECSRQTIQQFLIQNSVPSSLSLRYPQLCTTKQLPRHYAIRFRMPDQLMVFQDRLQGLIWGNPQREQGDIVLRRRGMRGQPKTGLVNYMLAVVIDDALQGINQVVRGLDILPLTIPQLVMADSLTLPLIEDYYHLPILVNSAGQKLSKQTLAEPISAYTPQTLLTVALQLLGQPKVDTNAPHIMLQQAVIQWDNRPLMGQKQRLCPSLATLDVK